MMKGVLYLLLIFVLQVSGQRLDTRWIMGYSCCSTEFGGLDIDFGSGGPNVSSIQRNISINCTVGGISDSNGNLLFVSNGIYIANSANDTMQNGSGLNPSLYTTSRINYGLAIPQANLVIPFPDDSTKYYLFHDTSDDMFGTWVTLNLYYSVIDMTLDGGLGGVIQKNVVLLHDSLIGGRITACKHANGRDWWLIVHQFHSGMVYKYLITPNGISGPTMQDLFTWRNLAFGQAIFSPQGNNFAFYEPYGDLDVLDFDRCTGTFSNLIHVDINDSAGIGGCAFSPSGKYLYVSSLNYIYQYDVESSNIDSTKYLVGIYDNYLEQGLHQNFYLAALAPDEKIYINCGDGSRYFHVINFPDSIGASCHFVQRGLPLPRWVAVTMPNYPNYLLGAESGTVCDSLPTGITTIRKPVDDYSVFPNPADVDLYVNLGNEKIESALVFNSLGQIVSISSELIKNEYLHFNVASLENGFYYIELLTEKQKIVRTFIKQ
ncbi:MAG: T9SS type A sorting domain-containing protein [Bacteroidetes bacterium]|nr:T9SS type A sorting domain-containing protein [Bacteroidota bacterium]